MPVRSAARDCKHRSSRSCCVIGAGAAPRRQSWRWVPSCASVTKGRKLVQFCCAAWVAAKRPVRSAPASWALNAWSPAIAP